MGAPGRRRMCRSAGSETPRTRHTSVVEMVLVMAMPEIHRGPRAIRLDPAWIQVPTYGAYQSPALASPQLGFEPSPAHENLATAGIESRH